MVNTLPHLEIYAFIDGYIEGYKAAGFKEEEAFKKALLQAKNKYNVALYRTALKDVINNLKPS